MVQALQFSLLSRHSVNYRFEVKIREDVGCEEVLWVFRCFLNDKIGFISWMKNKSNFVPSSFNFCGSTVSSVLKGTVGWKNCSVFPLSIWVRISSELQSAASCSLWHIREHLEYYNWKHVNKVLRANYRKSQISDNSGLINSTL